MLVQLRSVLPNLFSGYLSLQSVLAAWPENICCLEAAPEELSQFCSASPLFGQLVPECETVFGGCDLFYLLRETANHQLADYTQRELLPLPS